MCAVFADYVRSNKLLILRVLAVTKNENKVLGFSGVRCETGFPALRKSLFRGAEKGISPCRGAFSVTRERIFGDVTRLELYCNTVFIVLHDSDDGGA